MRADGSAKTYLLFSQLRKEFDREDLENLWRVVKAKYGYTMPEEAYERVLWGDLKVFIYDSDASGLILGRLRNTRKLVKANQGNTRPEEAYERMLWGDLKVMFKPDVESVIWRNLQGVNPSTSASGLKPSGTTKNGRISQTPSSNEKNKVEVQSRKVKSSLNKRNSDSKNVCNEHVKHPIKGAKPLCFVCNECLFDANHAICFIDHVNRDLKYLSLSKIAKSMTANRMEPDTSRGSDTSVAPSSSSFIDCRLSQKCFVYLDFMDALNT
ncbi:hypothetical protein Tco_0715856 [Tanacetum coccineum]